MRYPHLCVHVPCGSMMSPITPVNLERFSALFSSHATQAILTPFVFDTSCWRRLQWVIGRNITTNGDIPNKCIKGLRVPLCRSSTGDISLIDHDLHSSFPLLCWEGTTSACQRALHGIKILFILFLVVMPTTRHRLKQKLSLTRSTIMYVSMLF